MPTCAPVIVMRTVAIIQARVGSSRLPMKSLLCLRGHALIDWVVNRVSEAARLDGVVVAMPDTERDRVLQAHLEDWGVAVVRGSEQDVLSRFLLAAEVLQTSTTHTTTFPATTSGRTAWARKYCPGIFWRI